LKHSALSLIPLALLASAIQADTSFNRQPWLEDLEQVQAAFATKYADLEWEVFDRDLDLTAVFGRARVQLMASSSDSAARAALDDLTQQFGDRHVQISWNLRADSSKAAPRGLSCADLGYNTGMQAAPLAALMPGALPLRGSQSDKFPIALLHLQGHTIAIIKIKLFMPQGFPDYCESAVRQLGLGHDKPCDEHCADRVSAAAAAQMTADLAQALDTLKGAHVDVLLVDLAGNGGGSEWSEAAARMVTGIRLQSIPTYFMRGEHWARRLSAREEQVRAAAAATTGPDQRFLLGLADVVAQRKRDARTLCDGSPLWSGRHPDCTWLGDGFYSTGLLRSGETGELRGKPWGPLVFTPLKFPYQEGLWSGPLLVVVDGDTGSAAEQFAAELQDNHAAIIVGSPTVGAGCGHTDGGTPTTLKNSGGVLRLPDCVRMREGNLNLASGVQPDVLVGFRAADATRRQAALLEAKLPEAIDAALRQAAVRSSPRP
jgi:hypothetical protein